MKMVSCIVDNLLVNLTSTDTLFGLGWYKTLCNKLVSHVKCKKCSDMYDINYKTPNYLIRARKRCLFTQ